MLVPRKNSMIKQMVMARQVLMTRIPGELLMRKEVNRFQTVFSCILSTYVCVVHP